MSLDIFARKIWRSGGKTIKGEKQTIVEKIKGSDMNVLIDWVSERQTKFFKIGWSYLYSQHDIEDVMQNTIIKAYNNIEALREEKYFETWVISIFINECKSILRRRKRDAALDKMDNAAASDNGYSAVELKCCLEKVDEIYREALTLKYLSSYTQEEIAKMLNLPIGTIKSRVCRGLKQLKAVLKEEVL